MKPPSPLSVLQGHHRVDLISVTGALRDGHWLEHMCQNGAVIVYVADDIGSLALEMWPEARVDTPKGVDQ